MDEPDLDLIDDPYRHCVSCDQTYHEEYGHTCAICDEWICTNCWNDGHESTDEHGRRGG